MGEGEGSDRLFTGQRWDATIGLYDYGARFYDPQIGQFIQPDPIVPQPGNPIAWNRYAYVYNSPVNYTHSSGQQFRRNCQRFRATPESAFIDTLWDVLDLASDASACFGDNDALACYMLPADVLFLALPVVPGVADNVLRHADDVGDVAEDVADVGRRIEDVADMPPASQRAWSPDSGFYEVGYEAHLTGEDYPGLSDARHFQEANQRLHTAFQADPGFAAQMEELYPGIIEGVEPGARGAFPRRAPTSYLTWHHHPRRQGVLQLVLSSQHRSVGKVQQYLHPGGLGGMKIWGGGR